MGDGDGWTRCDLGHRHWGRFGAAGLLVVSRADASGDDAFGDVVLLQHRSPNTHGGASWALPGGARDSHEDALAAALREASEETTLDVSTVTPTGSYTDDHGGWSYTTVVATSPCRQPVAPNNWESDETRWWSLDAVAALHLHHGFAAAWPALREMLDAGPPDDDRQETSVG